MGELGEKEIESETLAWLGKTDGPYAVLTRQLSSGAHPCRELSLEVGIVNYSFISLLSGLDDRSDVVSKLITSAAITA
jgi:hypothetical protein